jgi:hypothetical protein
MPSPFACSWRHSASSFSAPSSQRRGNRWRSGKLMRRVTECVVLTIAFTALAQPALALSYLNCSTRKVVIICAASGDTSSTREEEVVFALYEATKTPTFLDNRPLTITRLGKSWISATVAQSRPVVCRIPPRALLHTDPLRRLRKILGLVSDQTKGSMAS